MAPSDAKRAWAASLAARSVSTTKTLEPRATDRLRRAAVRFAVLCSQSPSHSRLRSQAAAPRRLPGNESAISSRKLVASRATRTSLITHGVGRFRLLRNEMHDLPRLLDRTADRDPVGGPQEILRYGNAPRGGAFNHQDVHLSPSCSAAPQRLPPSGTVAGHRFVANRRWLHFGRINGLEHPTWKGLERTSHMKRSGEKQDRQPVMLGILPIPFPDPQSRRSSGVGRN